MRGRTVLPVSRPPMLRCTKNGNFRLTLERRKCEKAEQKLSKLIDAHLMPIGEKYGRDWTIVKRRIFLASHRKECIHSRNIGMPPRRSKKVLMATSALDRGLHGHHPVFRSRRGCLRWLTAPGRWVPSSGAPGKEALVVDEGEYVRGHPGGCPVLDDVRFAGYLDESPVPGNSGKFPAPGPGCHRVA